MSEYKEHDREGHVVVDRTVSPRYPHWFVGLDKPEHENTGFLEYHLSSLRLLLHPKQKDRYFVKGEMIYAFLNEVHDKKFTILGTCLNLQDGQAIAKKGPVVFKKYFDGKEVYLWKSVVTCREVNKKRGVQLISLVPFLCVRGNWVAIKWRWIKDDWIDTDPALCFQSNLGREEIKI